MQVREAQGTTLGCGASLDRPLPLQCAFSLPHHVQEECQPHSRIWDASPILLLLFEFCPLQEHINYQCHGVHVRKLPFSPSLTKTNQKKIQ